ncbi:MAG: hypothetical protein Q8N94_07615 [Methanoregula sp.]|nr:hypothetical protein [Methanoregula sp.]
MFTDYGWGCRSGGGLRWHLKERGVNEGARTGNERMWAGIRWKDPDVRTAIEHSGSFQVVLP